MIQSQINKVRPKKNIGEVGKKYVKELVLGEHFKYVDIDVLMERKRKSQMEKLTEAFRVICDNKGWIFANVLKNSQRAHAEQAILLGIFQMDNKYRAKNPEELAERIEKHIFSTVTTSEILKMAEDVKNIEIKNPELSEAIKTFLGANYAARYVVGASYKSGIKKQKTSEALETLKEALKPTP